MRLSTEPAPGMAFRVARYPPSRIRATDPVQNIRVQIQAVVQPIAGDVRVSHRMDIVVIPENIQEQVHGVGNDTIDIKGECCRINHESSYSSTQKARQAILRVFLLQAGYLAPKNTGLFVVFLSGDLLFAVTLSSRICCLICRSP
jgi:hypothetical protein